ncbi:MAG: hypothetical protein HQ515_14130 [Phycisphaeraceae bacterium]|nr:hypothetical protein [Phycisphaeraceae bacterium]
MDKYFVTECFSDTALTPVPLSPDDRLWIYGEQYGPYVLSLRRGRPHSRITSAHGWWEHLSVELPSRPQVGRLSFPAAKTRIGFYSSWGRRSWAIEEDGVRGHIEILSVNDSEIVAEYDIYVSCRPTAYRWRPPADDGERRIVTFLGRSCFSLTSRPEEDPIASEGSLYESGPDSVTNQRMHQSPGGAGDP